MKHGIIGHNKSVFTVLAVLSLLLISCSPTKHLGKNQYLLRKNHVKIKSNGEIANRPELKDNMERSIVQRPNSYTLGIPTKILLYNLKYKKNEKLTTEELTKSKTIERPVIYDSSTIPQSSLNIRSYIYNQGYFSAKVKDTVRFENKKAYVTYEVDAGGNFLVNKEIIKTTDSTVQQIINADATNATIKMGMEYANTLLPIERGRITSLLRDHGYYNFNQDNIIFQLDTADKMAMIDVEDQFENVIKFVQRQKIRRKPELDVIAQITADDVDSTFKRYHIGKVIVYPDNPNAKEYRDTGVFITKKYGDYTFKYKEYYVNASVLLNHIFISPGKYFMQSDYDRTISKLNELGIFQYIRISFDVDSTNDSLLNCTIILNKTLKHDFNCNFDATNGSTYAVGSALTVSYIDKNLFKGANFFRMSASGGIELPFVPNVGKTFFDHFVVLTKYYNLNASIDFPKFLSPIGAGNFANSNMPHTIFTIGNNLMDRVSYFSLSNTNFSFTYNWHETTTKTWDVSPAFVNIIRLPYQSDSFKTRIDTVPFLKDSYRQTFIEGENIAFTYSDQDKKLGKNYSYLHLGFEEAGALLGGLDKIGTALNSLYQIQYAQYLKLDVEGKHFFTFKKSTVAMRFAGGIGLPYGQSSALPYIKQYFVGGPYSLRGWRVRSLGPGRYFDSAAQNNVNYIDQTGDIKLEFNTEYRFKMAQFFSGLIKMNGAVFLDAGNIWSSKKESNYTGAEFAFNKLGQDIAADIGAGARFDILSFITLRFDVAFPIKKPYVLTNYGWVIKDVDFNNPTWRANNIVFNFAIGYPF